MTPLVAANNLCREVEQAHLTLRPDRLRLSLTGEAEAALLGSNPSRNSRSETHSDKTGADRNWPALASRRLPSQHRGRSPNPSKTHPSHGALVGRQFRYVTEYKCNTVWLLQASAATTAWRGARPFDGRPGASRLFGGRRRAVWPRC